MWFPPLLNPKNLKSTIAKNSFLYQKDSRSDLKQRDEINGRMAEMFGLLKELTIESEKVKENNEVDHEKLVETDIRISLASQSHIYHLGIAKDVLVEIAGFVYLVDFIILDIKEDRKNPFILGTPFLTTARAKIKFNKGTITLKSGKCKVNFHKRPELFCKFEEREDYKVDPLSIINERILEWEERIKLHREKELEFNQWRNKLFNEKNSVSIVVEVMWMTKEESRKE
ncbi:reverse transcriptase domain-containing protein [Tanacetum coccineum]